jgi:hypothetical protein
MMETLMIESLNRSECPADYFSAHSLWNLYISLLILNFLSVLFILLTLITTLIYQPSLLFPNRCKVDYFRSSIFIFGILAYSFFIVQVFIQLNA